MSDDWRDAARHVARMTAAELAILALPVGHPLIVAADHRAMALARIELAELRRALPAERDAIVAAVEAQRLAERAEARGGTLTPERWASQARKTDGDAMTNHPHLTSSAEFKAAMRRKLRQGDRAKGQAVRTWQWDRDRRAEKRARLERLLRRSA